ncbi:MAG: ntrC 1 [Verrucomicrobiales bacterium]|nr:ntrC 1 [Verrucomicrobiales bacterium]
MKKQNRILIADDDDVFRETTASFLRKTGYECVCAPDAATALQILALSKFDLLISDIEMPGNYNLELIQQLAKTAIGFPVILLTGHPTIQSAVQSVRLPVMAYLVKPPDPAELQELVRQSIKRYETYQTVSANRERLQNWSQDLGQIEGLLRESSQETATGPAEDYVALTFQNLLLTLVDLKKVIQVMAQQDGKQDQMFQVQMIDALKETVETLARTRQSFKSKELGELRRKLEALIQAA